MPLPIGAAALAALRAATSPAGRTAIKEAAKKAAKKTTKKVKKAVEEKPKLKTVQKRARTALGYGNRAQMADKVAEMKPQSRAKTLKAKAAKKKPVKKAK